jgi:hypothetical protein
VRRRRVAAWRLGGHTLQRLGRDEQRTDDMRVAQRAVIVQHFAGGGINPPGQDFNDLSGFGGRHWCCLPKENRIRARARQGSRRAPAVFSRGLKIGGRAPKSL